jgi:hypothetical protein
MEFCPCDTAGAVALAPIATDPTPEAVVKLPAAVA